MNIVTPIPTSLVFTTANVNTEAARRDNVLRETIPQSSQSDESAQQKGLGSESDRARAPGQPPAPVTYERPQPQTSGAATGLNQTDRDGDKDNGSDESAGKEGAEDRQQQQASQQEIEQLKQRDVEVRTHEKAHSSTGGQYAGNPQFEFQSGPDGNRYAVDGEVSIDISDAATPQQTLRKMQQIRAAALAPADPSPQDLKVAAEAAKKAFDARAEIAREATQKATEAPSANTVQVPTLDEIIANNTVSTPTRQLDEAVLSSRDNDKDNDYEQGERALEIDRTLMKSRIGVIQQFYQNVSEPHSTGFQASA